MVVIDSGESVENVMFALADFEVEMFNGIGFRSVILFQVLKKIIFTNIFQILQSIINVI